MQWQELKAREAVFTTMEAFDSMNRATPVESLDPRTSATPGTAGACKKALSTAAAFFDDCRGGPAALAAECRFCLSLWDIIEGCSGDNMKEVAIQRNLEVQLQRVADDLESREHMLVQPLERAFRKRFGPFPWPEKKD
jgi:hypothetical protein